MFFDRRFNRVERDGTNDENGHSQRSVVEWSVVKWSIRPSCEHIGGAARVINDAVRFEQGRNHDDALCAGVDHTLKIVDVDSADAENREIHFLMNSFDIFQTDRFVIGFVGVAKTGPKPM